MKHCGICGKEIDSGVVVHRKCLEESKAGYDRINDFEQSQVAKLLEEIARLKAEIVDLKARLSEE